MAAATIASLLGLLLIVPGAGAPGGVGAPGGAGAPGTSAERLDAAPGPAAPHAAGEPGVVAADQRDPPDEPFEDPFPEEEPFEDPFPEEEPFEDPFPEEPEGPPEPVEAAEPGRSTDTEYLKIQIDPAGRPVAGWLKNWIRLRGTGSREVVKPGFFADLTPLHGSPRPAVSETDLRWRVTVPPEGHLDLYYEGRLQQAGDLWMTPEGPAPLPVDVRIRYFVGEEGLEQEVEPAALEAADRPQRFKIAITAENQTRRQEEISYTDVQTGSTVVGVGPVYTPYVVRIADLTFPDSGFDRIRSDGDMLRKNRSTVVNWTQFLVPPDFPARQTATVTGVIAAGSQLPEITVVAQPIYPPLEAEALTSGGIQFERGRRTFFYDVFNLFRENLIALTGLFGLLHDAFGNLSIPILGPEKDNREAGDFDDPNQLWALWTLAKGMEQLSRAMNVLENAVELSRDAVKGQLATLQQLRLLLGFSQDEAATAAASFDSFEDDLLFGSVWADLKQMILLCDPTAATAWPGGNDPYLPTAPVVEGGLCAAGAIPLNLALLKLAILEHVMHSLQKQNHMLDTANLAGLAPLPPAAGPDRPDCDPAIPPDSPAGQTCDSYSKFHFIKFPFGLELLERGLWTIKERGFEPLQAAIGNTDAPNSIIWALHVLTDGAEAQVDAFHQLGATWRFIADGIQEFGIFGVETARNILQWDVNAIDLETGMRAAAVSRAREMATFMGRPTDPDGEPALGQLVIAFSTTSLAERTRATDTTGGTLAVGLSSALILATLLGWARFRWFLI